MTPGKSSRRADPTRGEGAWAATDVDSGNSLTGASCASVRSCVAVDDTGNVITSTEPTGDERAWTTADVDSTRFVSGISCPSVALCIAVDDSGNVFFGTGPSSPGWPANLAAPWISGSTVQGQTLTEAHGSWTNDPISYEYQWQRCNGAGENCLAIVGATSQTYTLTAPDVGSTIRVEEATSNAAGSGPPATSVPSGIIQAPPVSPGPSPPLAAVTTPTASVSVARLVASLKRELAPSGKAARIAVLLKHGGYKLVFKPLEAGTVVIDWYELPAGARSGTKTKPRPVLIATGRGRFSAAGTATIEIGLTPKGKRLLEHAKRLKLAAAGKFTPDHKTSVTATTSFVLKAT